MGIIFDLDQTLIDTDLALELRRNRDWQNVYKLIPRFTPYEGINELIEYIYVNNIPLCIVTNSPIFYCKQIISYWNWNISNLVCYHDTTLHKPHPAPILKALDKMNTQAENTISIGDDPKDIIASNKAGVISVAAIWGTHDEAALINSNPDYTCQNVDDLKEIVMDNFLNIQNNY
ncbi:HAD family hydrolase [Sedimentibacter sp. LTW-03]|uniref:HAD family hydrolase n=1 Tax=Sedimentibacter sp. LTW-03 TaxID=3453406 RepID=UPI003F87A218